MEIVSIHRTHPIVEAVALGRGSRNGLLRVPWGDVLVDFPSRDKSPPLLAVCYGYGV